MHIRGAGHTIQKCLNVFGVDEEVEIARFQQSPFLVKLRRGWQFDGELYC